MILIIVRFWGLSMPTYKFEHEFYSKTKASTSNDHLSNIEKAKVFHSFEETDKSLTQTPDLIVWISTYMTNDGFFIVDSDNQLNELVFTLKQKTQDTHEKENLKKAMPKFKGRHLHEYSLDEMKTLKPDLIKIEDVFTKYSQQRFIINIKSNAPEIDKKFIQLIQEFKLEKKIMIYSDYDIVLKTIKETLPMLNFATSISEVTRIKIFSTIHLTPAISIKGDAFVSQLKFKNRSLVNQEIIQEMKRRQKYIFLGPLSDAKDIETATAYQPTGVIYN